MIVTLHQQRKETSYDKRRDTKEKRNHPSRTTIRPSNGVVELLELLDTKKPLVVGDDWPLGIALRRPECHVLLDLRDGLGRVKTLWTRPSTVEDGMASV